MLGEAFGSHFKVKCRGSSLLEVVPLSGGRLRYPGRRSPSRRHRRRRPGRVIRDLGCGGGVREVHGRRGRVRHRSIGMVSGERRRRVP